MKKIFVTITSGTVARNILRTGVLKELLAKEDLQIILILPRTKDYFLEEFKHPRIFFEVAPDKIYSRFRKFFIILFNGLTYTDTERRMLKFGGAVRKPASKFVFWLKHATFTVISNIKFLKYLARWIEFNLFVEGDFDYLFVKYNPDLLFCSSIYSKLDVILIKAAKRFDTQSISMPKSWDTVGRLFFRCPTDKIIVNNQFMKNWIVNEQAIRSDKIYICGMPQFDIYHNKKEYLSKQEFCQRTKLDPNKPIVLFASEGKWTAWDDLCIDDYINSCRILEKYNLILRPHFSNIESRLYERFRKVPGIYVDDQNLRVTHIFCDSWDPTMENMEWFAEVLHAADVAVTFMSTVVLDAFSVGKPVVNIYYAPPAHGRTIIPPEALYNSVHCKSVLNEHSTPLAVSSAEVLTWIEKFIKDPLLLIKERQNTIDHICYKIDGKSASRIAKVVLDSL